jgi:transposase
MPARTLPVEPFMPAVKRLGRPRKVDLRGVVEGLLYILRTACPWRLLPHDFPNRSTVLSRQVDIL